MSYKGGDVENKNTATESYPVPQDRLYKDFTQATTDLKAAADTAYEARSPRFDELADLYRDFSRLRSRANRKYLQELSRSGHPDVHAYCAAMNAATTADVSTKAAYFKHGVKWVEA